VLPASPHTPPSEPRPIAVRPKQAAKLLSLSERKLRELCATGELPSLRVGSARLIAYSALTAWLNERAEAE
jgi:excisionase family DNA binding protein